MIRIEAVWLAVEPLDMRAGTDTALARVVRVFGSARAAVMSLVHSAGLNGHDPHVYLKDVMGRLPTQPASRIGELLPHRWQPIS